MDNDNNNIISLADHKEENFELMLECDCGCPVFKVTEKEGLVCMQCDASMSNYEVVPTDG